VVNERRRCNANAIDSQKRKPARDGVAVGSRLESESDSDRQQTLDRVRGEWKLSRLEDSSMAAVRCSAKHRPTDCGENSELEKLLTQARSVEGEDDSLGLMQSFDAVTIQLADTTPMIV